MKTKDYQNHHVIPVSLLGHDWQENIIRITKYDHNLLHNTLNLPYQKIRSFRLKTNHMVHRNSQEFIRELKKIHFSFFDNFDDLPIKLQALIRNSIRDQTFRIINTHRIEINTPKYNADMRKWLNFYHYALVLR